VSFPADLAAQVEQLAAQESRTTSELFREAFRAYRGRQIRKTLFDLNEAARLGKQSGYRPEDVEQLVHESRAARKAKRTA
jgi:hypothetical protein